MGFVTMCANKCVDDIVRFGYVCCILQYVLALLNSLLALAGIGLVIIGTSIDEYNQTLLTRDYLGPVALYVGLIVSLINCCGFVITLMESIYGFVVYIVTLAIMLFAEVTVIVSICSSGYYIKFVLHRVWLYLPEKNRTNLQKNLNCCGWDDAFFGENCPEFAKSTCWETFFNRLRDTDDIFFQTVMGIIVLKLVIIVFSVLFTRKLVNTEREIGNSSTQMETYLSTLNDTFSDPYNGGVLDSQSQMTIG